ncbi:MAG TPA: transposase [Gelidibacter sp.]|nr:transposase [Gelidibacter sp.]
MDCKTIAEMYGLDGKKFQRQYKKKISDFKTWEDRPHAEQWLIFPENITEELSIDEVALSGGELYTVLTSKRARGRKGSLVAIIRGTKSETVIGHLLKIDRKLRLKVKEITLDMAGSMKLIAKTCFPAAAQVVDRFHVQKLASEALQEIRIRHRWEAIEQEYKTIQEAKESGRTHSPELYSNGDTKKQLLARSRHLLYKSPNNWTENQVERARILFKLYPELEQAYRLTNELRTIYNQRIPKSLAMTRLAQWFRHIEESGFKSFNILLKTFTVHYKEIINYFEKRSTNASAESFNSKIKRFRANFRGVRDKTFFLFRLKNIFA